MIGAPNVGNKEFEDTVLDENDPMDEEDNSEFSMCSIDFNDRIKRQFIKN